MTEMNVEVAKVLEIMQTEFPREYMICLQRAHIMRLEEMLAAASSTEEAAVAQSAKLL